VKFDSFVIVFFLNIIVFTAIVVTVMIKQAFVFLIDMRSYLWHGDIRVDMLNTGVGYEISPSLKFPN